MKYVIKRAITVSIVSLIAINPVITYASTYTKGGTTSPSSTYKSYGTSYSRTYTKSGYTKSAPTNTTSNTKSDSNSDNNSNTTTNTSNNNYSSSKVKYTNASTSRTYSRYPSSSNNSNSSDSNASIPDKPTDTTSKPVDTSINFDAKNEVQKMYKLINDERAKRGIAPLQLNSTLTKIAQKKSDDMVQMNYLSHYSSKYGSIYDMISDAGLKYYNAGENISKHYNVDSAFKGFMGSSLHKKAILADHFTDVGIGITKTSTGMLKISVMFIEEK